MGWGTPIIMSQQERVPVTPDGGVVTARAVGTTMDGQEKGIYRLHRTYHGMFWGGWGKGGSRCSREQRVGKQQDKGTEGAGRVQAGAGQCTCLAVPCV